MAGDAPAEPEPVVDPRRFFLAFPGLSGVPPPGGLNSPLCFIIVITLDLQTK